MEFFGEVCNTEIDVDRLRNLLTISSLTQLCPSISMVDVSQDNEADIYCVWGSFLLRREELSYGVRFSLVDCPHAMAWTISWDKNSRKVIIHCTLDKQQFEQDFVESLQEFVTDWETGLARALQAS